MEFVVGIVWITEVTRTHAARVGSKAANLGELIRIGMPVPPAFVVDAASYEQHAPVHGTGGTP
ncbi:MAG: hypothetical protein OEY20_16410 [Gemmatimonadota bacterium]|nr:hypothetical protein [Gemmatimonadota bacterium]MDH4351606.1 hypothetical protein [Gemmatimonadota bacterium]MDH5198825.1 hypothetical protein [Gemmatimonadota bacterium]